MLIKPLWALSKGPSLDPSPTVQHTIFETSAHKDNPQQPLSFERECRERSISSSIIFIQHTSGGILNIINHPVKLMGGNPETMGKKR